MSRERARRTQAQATAARLKAQEDLARHWRDWHSTPHGRDAIAALMIEFNIYTQSPGSDPHVALREKGQRDVLLRIVQLVGLRPEHFVDTAWEDTDSVENYTRNH